MSFFIFPPFIENALHFFYPVTASGLPVLLADGHPAEMISWVVRNYALPGKFRERFFNRLQNVVYRLRPQPSGKKAVLKFYQRYFKLYFFI
jgi:hypothetical protein